MRPEIFISILRESHLPFPSPPATATGHTRTLTRLTQTDLQQTWSRKKNGATVCALCESRLDDVPWEDIAIATNNRKAIMAALANQGRKDSSRSIGYRNVKCIQRNRNKTIQSDEVRELRCAVLTELFDGRAVSQLRLNATVYKRRGEVVCDRLLPG